MFRNLIVLVCASVIWILTACAGSKTPGDLHSQNADSELRPLPLSDLVSGRVVALRVLKDTLMNCDTTSSYKMIVRDTTDKSRPYEKFSADSDAVRQFTYLNASGDSLFFSTSIRKGNGENRFTSVCIEKSNIGGVFATKETAAEPEHHRHAGRGRHRDGGMGGEGMGGM